MSDGESRTQILRLEDEIEELTEVLERCRKIILISKIAVAKEKPRPPEAQGFEVDP